MFFSPGLGLLGNGYSNLVTVKSAIGLGSGDEDILFLPFDANKSESLTAHKKCAYDLREDFPPFFSLLLYDYLSFHRHKDNHKDIYLEEFFIPNTSHLTTGICLRTS